MDDLLWYLYQNEQQVGPFALAQVHQMHEGKMVTPSAYVYKVGWKDWRPFEDCYEELGLEREGQEPATPDRRESAPRATVAGRVVVHNNSRLSVGSGVNISSTGLFIENNDEIFEVGERVKLSVKVGGISSFNATAIVIRYNSDSRFPVGFGLRFESIPEEISSQIDKLVGNHHTTKAG